MPDEQQRDVNAPPPQQGQSFLERKTAQLRQEQAESGTNRNDPLDAEPEMSAPLRDEASVQEDGYPELHDEEERLEEDAEPEEALEDEAPSEDEDDGEPERDVNWEKRYKDTQIELERLRTRDRERDEEVGQQLSGAVELHHQVEDELEKAKSYTEFYIQGVDQRIQQLEAAFTSGQIEPDKLQEARQYHYQLTQERQELVGRIEQLSSEKTEAEQKRKKREAEIARVRLTRTIPGWGKEKYAEMREAALDRGYTPEEFGNITDHRYFELLHDSMTLRGADKTIENVTERTRAKRPRRGKGRVSEQSRDSGGRFQKRQREFKENPNQPGRFAAMAEERLRKERRGR
jgi:hypothetical protein